MAAQKVDFVVWKSPDECGTPRTRRSNPTLSRANSSTPQLRVCKLQHLVCFGVHFQELDIYPKFCGFDRLSGPTILECDVSSTKRWAADLSKLACLRLLAPSLPRFLASLLPCFLVSLFRCFLVSLLPCFLASLLPCFLASLLPCLPACLPACLLACLQAL